MKTTYMPQRRLRLSTLLLSLGLLAGCMEQQELPTAPAPDAAGFSQQASTTCEVTTLTDGDGVPGSLRTRIADDNCAVITFGLTGTLTLDPDQGALEIARNVVISGPGADLLTVRRDPTVEQVFRVFRIYAGNTVQISGLTISGGDGGYGGGGGIRNAGALTLSHSVVSGNASSWAGGGIESAGGNAALTLIQSTVSGNQGVLGGGIANQRTMTLRNSTVSGNTAVEGGGIAAWGSSTLTFITHSTVSGNTASARGGAIYSSGNTLALRGSLVAGNNAPAVPDIVHLNPNPARMR
jgi:predicted outer membrane repeat protein